MTFNLTDTYRPLSSADTLSLMTRLTRQGVPADEAVTQIATINYVAKKTHKSAQVVLEDWLLQQQQRTEYAR